MRLWTIYITHNYSGLHSTVCHKTVNWVSSEWFKWLVIIRNGKSIAPFHRLLVSDVSFECAPLGLCLQGQGFKEPPAIVLQRAPVRAFLHLWVLRAPHSDLGSGCSCLMNQVTHSVKAFGRLGLVPHTLVILGGWVGGRYELSDERGHVEF